MFFFIFSTFLFSNDQILYPTKPVELLYKMTFKSLI